MFVMRMVRQFVALVVAVLMGFGGFFAYKELCEPEPIVLVSASDIRDVQELATISYNYNTYVKYEKERPKIPLTDWDVPCTRSRAAFNVVGCIKVGINMDNLTLSQDGTEINITIPKAEILSHELDLSKTKVLYEDTSILNMPEATDYLEYIRLQKERIGQSELPASVLASAQERAKQIISDRIHQIDGKLKVIFVG